MNSSRIESVVVALVLIAGGDPVFAGGKSSAPESRVRALQKVAPNVSWETVSSSGDFDCDSREDHAILGRKNGEVFVGIVRAQGKPQVLKFAVDRSRQDAVCSEPVELETESLDYDPSQVLSDTSGFRRSRRCQGLVLTDNECDSIHLYWDHKTRRVEWWRR